ncbi:MAG TPA: glycosyltransferase family 39 protein [Terriglobales bacterium]|nr:glycosyltransferase family 39 protein [Terriglobales bacterium]
MRETRYIRYVRDLVRRYPRFFLLATLAALVLRLIFFFWFSRVTNDSFVYGDIAKNWLQQGVYGLSSPGGPAPTFIRLPGYPAFLAAVFAIFGMEHYRAAIFLQLFVDLGTCFLIADIARRLISDRAARAAFLLAGLCPFLANYAAAALTETLEIFFTALALNLALRALHDLSQWRHWAACGLAVAAAILLRPDGGLLLGAIGLYLAWILIQQVRGGGSPWPAVRAGAVLTLVAIAPLVPWTLRNLYTIHRFQPLAPRYANEVDEVVPTGFNRWVKTWMADYSSTEEIYWAVPGAPMDVAKLPSRAFDSPTQREETERLVADYNQGTAVTPEIDTGFAALASERIRHAPLRYYLWLPAVRSLDMWLRPRTELLPCDTRWWEFNDDLEWSALAVGLGLIGVFYAGLALLGLIRGRFRPHLGMLLIFVVLRSVFLGTLENPEPRYTLEMYPVLIVLAAAFFGR